MIVHVEVICPTAPVVDVKCETIEVSIAPPTVVAVQVVCPGVPDVVVQFGAGPPGPSVVLNEIPAGPVNGSNATFTTARGFIPERVAVRINGLGQRPGIDFYTVGRSTIQLTSSPSIGESIAVDYAEVP